MTCVELDPNIHVTRVCGTDPGDPFDIVRPPADSLPRTGGRVMRAVTTPKTPRWTPRKCRHWCRRFARRRGLRVCR